MFISINSDVPKIRRKTDSLLDWLGDWGGLLDSLYFLGDILVSPLSAYMMRSKLAQLLVKVLPSEFKNNGASKKLYVDSHDDPKRQRILSNMIIHFNNIHKVEPSSYLKSYIERYRSSKRYKLLEKSEKKI